MNTPLNIGLIGCGRVVERFYLTPLSRLKEARLVAVADPIPERRKLFSSTIPGCLAFTSAEELLEKTKIAAVIITTPPETHVAMTALALRAGVPVLVEKPLAPSLAGVEELESLVASPKASVMVGFNRRHWRPTCQLRRIIRNYHHPDIMSAQLVMTTDMRAWSPIGGVGDPLDDLGSHQLDILRYIFDSEISAISARWADTHTIQMRVRLANGVISDCLASYSNVYQESVVIQCERRRYRIHTASDRIQPPAGPIRSVLDFSDAFRRRLRGLQSPLRSSYERQLKKFFHYTRTGTIPQPGITDGVAAIRAVEAARKSAACNGKEIIVTQ